MGIGHAKPPLWAAIIKVGEYFGIPPWQIAEECDSYWWLRMGIYMRERKEADNARTH